MKQVKTKISLFLFLLINFAFSVKYLSRITPYYFLLSVVVAGFCFVVWECRNKAIFLAFEHRANRISLALIASFILLFSFVFSKISAESLNVDRWSVITSFWDAYFNGEYVYFAKSHAGNPPGPMPFYFILALPFYFLNELGYFSILGVLVFMFLLKANKVSPRIRLIFLVLTLSSVFYLWEVISRSNLFLNASLVLLSITYLFHSTENKKPLVILSNGIFIGLMLSTRNVFIIPCIIAFLYLLKTQTLSVKATFRIGFVALAVLGITFLPFVVNHSGKFWQLNPFMIQSGYLMPTAYSLLCVAASTLIFFVVKSKNDVFFYSGLLLFLTILLHLIHKVALCGFTEAFFNSKADISYFILCVPFLMYYLAVSEKTVPRGSA